MKLLLKLIMHTHKHAPACTAQHQGAVKTYCVLCKHKYVHIVSNSIAAIATVIMLLPLIFLHEEAENLNIIGLKCMKSEFSLIRFNGNVINNSCTINGYGNGVDNEGDDDNVVGNNNRLNTTTLIVIAIQHYIAKVPMKHNVLTNFTSLMYTRVTRKREYIRNFVIFHLEPIWNTHKSKKETGLNWSRVITVQSMELEMDLDLTGIVQHLGTCQRITAHARHPNGVQRTDEILNNDVWSNCQNCGSLTTNENNNNSDTNKNTKDSNYDDDDDD
uniref:Uncharacterized protein n=1 Tax=Glossina palpalis gambiensis TaxID=67801 RepID=A0A1B0B315_9MUSC